MRLRPLLFLALTACQPGGAYGPLPDPVVTVLDPGEGAENELPLEPLRLGSWGESGDRWHRVSGPIDVGRDSIIVIDTSETVGLVRERRGDVVLHRVGAPLDPERPSGLWVPERVRLGMRWESTLTDGARYGLEVTAREERVTPLGPVTAWGLTELWSEGDIVDNAPTYWYAEGWGSLGVAFGSSTTSGDAALQAWVYPEVDQPAGLPPLEPVPLSPLLDPFGAAIAPLQGLAAGAWTALVEGEPMLVNHTTRVSPDNVVQTFAFCYPLSAAGDALGRASRCQESLTVGTSGFPSQKGMQHLRLLRGLPADAAHAWREGGELRSLDDRPDASGNTGARALWLRRGEAVLDLQACATSEGACEVITDQALERGLFDAWSWSDHVSGWSGAGPTPQVTFGLWEVAPGAPVIFGSVSRDGRVFEARVEAGTLRGWRLAGVLPGEISVADGVEGPAIVGLTRDLRLSRARVTADGVVVEDLGTLQAGIFSDSLATATLDPADDGRAIVSLVPRGPLFYDVEGPWAFMRVAQLPRAPEPIAAPASLAIGFGDWLGQPAVCWPAADVEPDPGSWTLRGAPVDAVVGGPHGRCAILRDAGEVDPAWVGAERAMRLDLPGVGPVRLGYLAGTRVWDFGAPLQGMVAPTRDGGAVDVAGLLLDADGFPVERTPTGMAQGNLWRAWRDLAGDGLYAVPYNDGPRGALRALGSTTLVPEDEGWMWLGGVVGGGALLEDGEDWVRFGAGDPVAVPESQRLAVLDVLRGTSGWQGGAEGTVVGLPDGDICVGRARTVACVTPAGETRRMDGYEVEVAAIEGHSFWPLPGGALLILSSSGRLFQLDPLTMAHAPYAEGYLDGLLVDAEGRSMGVFRPLDGGAWGVELAVNGPRLAIDLPATDTTVDVVPLGSGAWLTFQDRVWGLRWE